MSNVIYSPITKAVLVAFGLIALNAYIAPFRQQATDANHCVSWQARGMKLNWEHDNPGEEYIQARRDRDRAEAYFYCQGR